MPDAAPRIAVEVADHRFAKRRFRDLPVALHGRDPAWSPPLSADPDRFSAKPARKADPWFEAGGVSALLLARIAGSDAPLARCTAHYVPGRPEGWFGFVDAPPAPVVGAAAVRRLVEEAATLLAEEGCTSLTGPASYLVAQEGGAVVVGADEPAVTGRPWSEPWLPGALAAAGLEPDEEQRWHVLDPAAVGVARGTPSKKLAQAALPRSLVPFADERLALEVDAVGRIVAVPDLAGAKRAAVEGGASRWSLAKAAAERSYPGCCVVFVDGDPSVLVPALCASAADAGYPLVHSPWAPAGVAPAVVARTFRRDL